MCSQISINNNLNKSYQTNRFVELFLGYILIPLFKPYDPLCFLRCLFESYRVLCGHSLQKTSREKSLGPVRFLWGPTWSLYGKKILLHSCTNYEKIRFWKKNFTFFWNFLEKYFGFFFLEYLIPLLFLCNPGGPMCYFSCSFEFYLVLRGHMWSYGAPSYGDIWVSFPSKMIKGRKTFVWQKKLYCIIVRIMKK